MCPPERLPLRSSVSRLTAVAATFIAALAIAPRAQAGASAAASSPDEQLEQLDESLVEGRRIRQLRDAIVDVEDRFYALYNELNPDDDFDVHCAQRARLGTRVPRRTCIVAYVEKAQAAESRDLVFWMQADPVAQAQGPNATSASVVALERFNEYRATALKVINGDARLLRLIREREELERRYVEEGRRKFGVSLARKPTQRQLAATESLFASTGPAPPDTTARTVTTPEGEVLEELDEVVVVQGSKLWQMRKQLEEAQNRIFYLYNELNEDEDYDLHCRQDARTGTRLMTRQCLVQFFEQAQLEYAQGRSGTDPGVVWQARYPEYRAVQAEVIGSDPLLRRLIDDHDRLERRYEEERKRRFKGRLILFE